MNETTRPGSSATLTAEEFDRLYERAIERMRRDPEKRKMLEALELFESLSAIKPGKEKKTIAPVA